jgi:hypothetical protein
MGWMWRSLSDPRKFAPRYWHARHLVPMLLRYRERLPQMSIEPRPPIHVQMPASVGADGLPDSRDISGV